MTSFCITVSHVYEKVYTYFQDFQDLDLLPLYNGLVLMFLTNAMYSIQTDSNAPQYINLLGIDEREMQWDLLLTS